MGMVDADILLSLKQMQNIGYRKFEAINKEIKSPYQSFKKLDGKCLQYGNAN